jgi:hypothetical protein
MSEPSRVRSAFEDLRIDTLPKITPPGVDAARRTLHRRRARRTATALVTASVLAAGAIAGITRPWSSPSTPVGGPPPTPSASIWASPTPSAATPSALVSSSPPSVAPGQGGGPPPCAKDGVGIPITTGDGTYLMEFSPLHSFAKTPCAGVQVKVWLVYYRTGTDGTRTLLNTEISYLTAATRSVPLSPQGGPCVSWLIGSGTGPIPDQLPASDDWLNQPGPASPFWDSVHGQTGVREVSLNSDCPAATPSPTPAEPEPTPTP